MTSAAASVFDYCGVPSAALTYVGSTNAMLTALATVDSLSCFVSTWCAVRIDGLQAIPPAE